MSVIKEHVKSYKSTRELDYDVEHINYDSEISTSRFRENMPTPGKNKQG